MKAAVQEGDALAAGSHASSSQGKWHSSADGAWQERRAGGGHCLAGARWICSLLFSTMPSPGVAVHKWSSAAAAG